MKKYTKYISSFVALLVVAVVSVFGPEIFHFFEAQGEHELIETFFIISVLFVLSFVVFYIADSTKLPSFVIAIFFGLAGHGLLQPIVEKQEVLGVLVGFGATLILFSGGLETPFANFKKLFWKIFSLSFPGLLATALLLSLSVALLGTWFHVSISLLVAVLLGAVLASTDPAAIIPILKRLRFKNRDTKDLIISESAVTDVTGTLLTVAFLGLMVSGVALGSVTDWYGAIFSAESGIILAKQLAFGIIFGVVGYGFLEILKKFKHSHEQEFEADSAFFLFIPIIIFTLALSFGGSGYLAAFIAGLLFSLTEKLHETERFFNHLIDGFFKPTIFILLGSLVNPQELLSYAGVGIAAAIVFMGIIRPFTVFLTLGGFSFFGKNRFSWRELVFISFVRETGAIPAVLLVTVVSFGLPGMDGLVPIGMWVILLTLIVEPILTPWVATKLKVAEPISDTKKVHLGEAPLVVLVTRGRSFVDRLPYVVNWANTHSIKRVFVMLCLEQKYTPELSAEIEAEAKQVFAKINAEREKASESPLEFEFISRTGLLQDNIDALSKEHENVTTIFVGRKMLDYRFNEIKQLRVPLHFMD